MTSQPAQPAPQSNAKLSIQDLQQLAKEPSARMRAVLGAKICQGYNDKIYSQRETDLALEVLRLLLRDTSLRVRRILSEHLQHNEDVPRDIVLALASDHELVAEAVLSNSPVLEEDDLLAIVHSTHNLRKLLAIAARNTLSRELSGALIEKGEHELTMQVISNAGAHIHDDTFGYILEEYYQDDSILEALVARSSLPYTVAEKLFYLVGSAMQNKLNQLYDLRLGSFEDIAKRASEGAMLRFMSPWMAQQDIQQLVQEMYKQERLTDSMIIRSLCIGDLRFFQTAMAKRAGTSVSNAKILLLDPQGSGFDACYKKAGMPQSMLEAIRCVYLFALEETELGRYFHEQFTQRIIERITFEGKRESIPQMPALLSMLGNTALEVTRHVH